ncbi:protein FLX-like 2 [Phoenix dactylifera]|uniref:Protein FLX-like 2 n=1 Tax=Phoenix dactylifera TaxID=42345 RepID=A0A8B9ATX5_PHODC|nr:protein FLX-like 2 [Phoenix dactylifera]
MASSGHKPSESERQRIEAPGLLYDRSYPGWGEENIAAQAAEIESLVGKNQGLIASNATLRQEILYTQQEMQRLQAYVARVQTERNMQIRGLLEKIRKTEADVSDGEIVKRELRKAYLERHSLVAEKQELIIKIQRVTEELQKAYTDIRKLPEMHAETDGLRQDYQRICAAFGSERSLNAEKVKQMNAMEGYLISMASEAAKLRTELANAPNPYGGIYGSPDPIQALSGQSDKECRYGQGGGHVDCFYGYGENPGASLGHGGSVSCAEVYGMTQAQVTSAIDGDGLNASTGESFAGEETNPSQVTIISGGLAAEGVSGVGDETGGGAP